MKKILLTLLVAALAYAYQQYAPEATASESAPAATKATLPEKKSAQQPRAKGLEIPAYLTDRPEEIVVHEGFTLSFNRKHKLPNWVAWVLTDERTRMEMKRDDYFTPDPDVRKGPTATHADYKKSGYQRGHMCPAADCKMSRQALDESCYMSNICPQLGSLNGGDWKELEERCRKWARAYDSIYIVCGPILTKDETYAHIGEGRVTVPHRFFKVVMRHKKGDDVAAIGFVYHQEDADHPISHYAHTVDEVEALTGINFFSKLPREVEVRAEAAYDLHDWQGLR